MQNSNARGQAKRLRARLLAHGQNTLDDYEILELLLSTLIPQRDVQSLADGLIKEFGNLWRLLNASPRRLLAAGLSEPIVTTVVSIAAMALRAQRTLIIKRSVFNSWHSILNYCHATMEHETKEQIRLFFLDRKNHLLSEEVHQRGTIDHAYIYPREIVQRALEVGAGALIVAHNHPSGNSNPSKNDIKMTHAIVEACRALDIIVHDHIIIGQGEPTSFRSLGLL